MKLLSQKIALITGASRGIGAATAKLLAAHGASVAVNYARSAEAADQVVQEIAKAGGRALAVQADVSDPEQIKQMVDTVKNELGIIDIMVLNAGFTFPTVPFIQYPWQDFEKKLTNEIKSAFFCCKEVVPMMLEKKSGCIVAVSSGLSRQPGIGFVAHSSAKSALDAFVKSLALELGPEGIRVNVVAPGLTETDAISHMPEEIKKQMADHTPLRRNAMPDDIAGAVLMMASEETRFVTGAYLPVSGGGHMI
ncbi:MAG: SDR family oxidoreductase [Proteobacteria bacterium]|nr:SDR family oxidoreductase [Pseudomonadota bacterium]